MTKLRLFESLQSVPEVCGFYLFTLVVLHLPQRVGGGFFGHLKGDSRLRQKEFLFQGVFPLGYRKDHISDFRF